MALSVDAHPASSPINEQVEEAFEEGRADVGMRILQQYVDAHPEDMQALNNNGVLQLTYARFKEAEASFRHVLELKPSYSPAWNNLGLCLMEQGRTKEMIEAFKLALSLDSENSEASLNLAVISKTAGSEPVGARYFLKALEAQSPNNKLRVGIGEYLMCQGKLMGAHEVLDEALDVDPDFVLALMDRGWLHLKQAELEAAKNDFERVTQLEPKNAKAQRGMALAFCYQGRMQEAIEAYRLSRKLDPSSDAARVDQGLVFQGLRLGSSNEQDRMEFLRTLSHDPKGLLVSYNLAVLLAPTWGGCLRIGGRLADTIGFGTGMDSGFEIGLSAMATGLTTHELLFNEDWAAIIRNTVTRLEAGRLTLRPGQNLRGFANDLQERGDVISSGDKEALKAFISQYFETPLMCVGFVGRPRTIEEGEQLDVRATITGGKPPFVFSWSSSEGDSLRGGPTFDSYSTVTRQPFNRVGNQWIRVDVTDSSTPKRLVAAAEFQIEVIKRHTPLSMALAQRKCSEGPE